MGYLDREELDPADELVVYVQVNRIKETYRIMPQLMEQLGFETNEYGSYENHFRYHGRLLSLYFVFPPAEGFFRRYAGAFIAPCFCMQPW